MGRKISYKLDDEEDSQFLKITTTKNNSILLELKEEYYDKEDLIYFLGYNICSDDDNYTVCEKCEAIKVVSEILDVMSYTYKKVRISYD